MTSTVGGALPGRLFACGTQIPLKSNDGNEKPTNELRTSWSGLEQGSTTTGESGDEHSGELPAHPNSSLAVDADGDVEFQVDGVVHY